jgi:hypothetical protein
MVDAGGSGRKAHCRPDQVHFSIEIAKNPADEGRLPAIFPER